MSREKRIDTHAELTYGEREQLGITNRSFSPFEEIAGADELLGINRPVYALYTKGVEVVSKVNNHEISSENGFLRIPTLRKLAYKA